MNLSNKQYSVIIKTWRKDDFEWLFKIGSEIYSEIFRMAPEMKSLFPYVDECEKNRTDFKDSKQFRKQALRFVQVLSQAVNLLIENEPSSSLNEFKKILYDLGDRHRKFVKLGFKIEYWNYFNYAVVRVMENECTQNNFDQPDNQEKQAGSEGWQILANFIIDNMKKGFNENMTQE